MKLISREFFQQKTILSSVVSEELGAFEWKTNFRTTLISTFFRLLTNYSAEFWDIRCLILISISYSIKVKNNYYLHKIINFLCPFNRTHVKIFMPNSHRNFLEHVFQMSVTIEPVWGKLLFKTFLTYSWSLFSVQFKSIINL